MWSEAIEGGGAAIRWIPEVHTGEKESGGWEWRQVWHKSQLLEFVWKWEQGELGIGEQRKAAEYGERRW